MNPYLNFPNGDCKAAFDLYQQVFGATCLFSHTWAESPMADQAPGGDGSKIMHATLRLPRGSLPMGADCPPEYAPLRRLLAVGQHEGRGRGAAAVRRDLRGR